MTKKNEFHCNGQTYPVWINRKGYSCVTINDGYKDRAYLLHRLVWETNNGPVPPNHELHHIDRNKANWSLDNLQAVDRETHREMHRKVKPTEEDIKAGTGNLKNMNLTPTRQRIDP